MLESSSSANVVPVGREVRRGGFTLVEVLAVIAIVGILAAILISSGQRASEAGRVAKAKTELAALAAGLESYRRRHGEYPQTQDAAEMIRALLGRQGPDGAAIAGRAHIEVARFTLVERADASDDTGVQIADPWGRPYHYFYRTAGSSGWNMPGFVLYSAGPNGLHLPPDRTTGFFDPLALENADNLYAGQ